MEKLKAVFKWLIDKQLKVVEINVSIIECNVHAHNVHAHKVRVLVLLETMPELIEASLLLKMYSVKFFEHRKPTIQFEASFYNNDVSEEWKLKHDSFGKFLASNTEMARLFKLRDEKEVFIWKDQSKAKRYAEEELTIEVIQSAGWADSALIVVSSEGACQKCFWEIANNKLNRLGK